MAINYTVSWTCGGCWFSPRQQDLIYEWGHIHNSHLKPESSVCSTLLGDRCSTCKQLSQLTLGGSHVALTLWRQESLSNNPSIAALWCQRLVFNPCSGGSVTLVTAKAARGLCQQEGGRQGVAPRCVTGCVCVPAVLMPWQLMSAWPRLQQLPSCSWLMLWCWRARPPATPLTPGSWEVRAGHQRGGKGERGETLTVGFGLLWFDQNERIWGVTQVGCGMLPCSSLAGQKWQLFQAFVTLNDAEA